MREFDNRINAKEAFYHMASKAERVNSHARIWFERPAYGKYEGRRYFDERVERDREKSDLEQDARHES